MKDCTNPLYLGRPLDTVSAFVVDPNTGPDDVVPVPIGTAGELVFGGHQVALGYFNRPDLMAQNFAEHPKLGRLYRTGDLGRMLPDGSLLFEGRLDGQVKIRGQRVELAEIDNISTSSGIVRLSATVLITFTCRSEQLATFYVDLETGDGTSTKNELARVLRTKLPGYMVPSYFIHVDMLPFTPAGKVDHERLAETFHKMSLKELADAAVAEPVDEDDDSELTETEIKIADAIANSLKVPMEDIRRWTPLASLGLDSISAIGLSKELSLRLETRIAISTILRNKSLGYLGAALAGEICRNEEKEVSTAILDDLEVPQVSTQAVLEVFGYGIIHQLATQFDANPSCIEAVLPCTPLQEELLTSSNLNHMVFTIRVPAVEMMLYWDHMRVRHQILRTCFVVTDNSEYPIAQVVLSVTGTSAAGFHWRHYKTDSEPLELCLSRHEESMSPHIDSFEPPISLAIINHGNVELLSFVCHHALYDGVAVGCLLEEVEMLANSKTLAPPLSPLPFLEAILEVPLDVDKFWTETFKEFVPSYLPRTGAKFPASQADGLEVVGVFSSSVPIPLALVYEGLRDLSTSLLSLCQTAWTAVLSTLTRNPDVCFGLVLNGRSVLVPDIERLVFPCFNTIPLRVNTSARQGIQQYSVLLQYFQALNSRLLSYQFTPLRKIQTQCSTESKLFDSLLLLQQEVRELDPELWILEQDEGIMDVPLVCEVLPSGDELAIKIHHHRSLVSSETAALAFEIFCMALITALRFPNSRMVSSSSLPSHIKEIVESLDLVHQNPSIPSHYDSSTTELDHPASASHTSTLVGDETGAWTATESQIRSTLAGFAACYHSRVGKKTTIYELGLDSVSAVQIAAALRKQGLAVTATDVIENPSSSSLARKLALPSGTPSESQAVAVSADATEAGAEEPSPPSIGLNLEDLQEFLPAYFGNKKRVEACLPCTPLQEGLLTSFASSEGRLYMNRVAFQVRSDCLSAADFVHAWVKTARVHPMLRTGFVAVDHGIHGFAMARYEPGFLHVPAKIFTSDEFSLDLWFEQTRRRVLGQLNRPPWEVALVEDGGDGVSEQRGQKLKRLTMHLALHHAIYDAYSLKIMLEDFSYHLSHPEQELPITFIEPALSQLHSFYQSGAPSSRGSNSEAFWSSLSESAVINKFPALVSVVEPNPHMETLAGSVPQLQALKQHARQAGITVQAAMQAAWTRILSSYVGDASVVFGVVLSGRTTEDLASTPFPCVNTLPVVARNEKWNKELLDKMMEYNTSLHRHQYARLSQIQSWLGNAGRSLFDTVLTYQKLPSSPKAEPKNLLELVDESAEAEYVVSLELIPSAINPDELGLQLTFSTAVLTRDTARLVLDQFTAVFVHLLQFPEAEEQDLFHSKMLTESEKHRLFSITPPDKPLLVAVDGKDEIKFLHHFLETSARRYPDRIALEFVSSFQPLQREVWTYKDLDAMGNRVANLIAKSVDPGEIIGVCFQKCPEAYFTIVGILKSGCSFVALDPTAPRARKEFIICDAGARLIICSDDQELDFKSPVPILCPTASTLASSSPEPPVLSHPVSRQDRSYCLYTSGTTGTPKGCELTHHNAVQALLAFRYLFASRTNQSSKCLQFAPFHFDVSVLEQYWTWGEGLTLSSVPRDLVLEDPAEAINALRITHIDLTPSLAQLLTPEMVPSLSDGVFITGGERMRQIILDNWGHKGCIYNAYGPTETTIGVTMYAGVPENGRPSNIGGQFRNVGSFVLKPGTDEPVMRLAVGELCVSGPLVGKGYLGQPELTAEKFPTLMPWDERVYRTGDLVRILCSGQFEFVGREDDQVKLRGQRLEIGEIDCAVRAVEEVGDVVTIVGRAGVGSGRDVLVSFFVASAPYTRSSPRQATAHLRKSISSDGKDVVLVRDDNEVTQSMVRKVLKSCRERLPRYMIPTYVLRVEAIPLSASNKAEVKVLKRFFRDLPLETLLELSGTTDAGTGHIGALSGRDLTTSIRQNLVTILSVLREMNLVQEDVNEATLSSASIFELGIDSVSVLRFSRKLSASGFDRATPSIILAHPLLTDLAVVLAEQAQNIPNADVENLGLAEITRRIEDMSRKYIPIVAANLGNLEMDIEHVLPCTPLQEGLIARFLERPGKGLYHHTFKFLLGDSVSLKKLQAAWENVVQNHPILRSKFIPGPDGFAQVSLRHPESKVWKGEYVLPVDPDEAAPVLNSVLASLRKCWVDRNKLVVHDVLHVSVFTVGRNKERRRIMVMNIFHGIYDGTSLELLLRCVAECYLDHTGADSSSPAHFHEILPHGPLADFSSSKDFWLDHFRDVVLSKIPVLPQSSSPPSSRRAAITARRSVPFNTVYKVSSNLAVTSQSVLLAAWCFVLSAMLPPSSTITTGIILSGRSLPLPDIENIIGPLFNTIPFAVSFRSGITWERLVRKCHSFGMRTLPFQHVPLRRVQKWCSRGQPLFDSLFSFAREMGDEFEVPRQLWREFDAQEAKDEPDYALAVEATAMKDGTLRLEIVARSNVADSTAVEKLLERFEVALGKMTSCLHESVSLNAAKICLSHAERCHVQEASQPVIGVEGEADRIFQWTPIAVEIRDQIARLANITIDAVSPTTSILELGLDSIDIIKLAARLREKSIRVGYSSILRSLTVERIAARIAEVPGALTANSTRVPDEYPTPHPHSSPSFTDRNQNSYHNDDAHTLDLDVLSHALCRRLEEVNHDLLGVEAVLPPTPLQDAMVADMINFDFTRYFNQVAYFIPPGTDIPKLERAWQAVIDASPMLRTVFYEFPGAPEDAADLEVGSRGQFGYAQVVLQPQKWAINHFTLASMEQMTRVMELARQKAANSQGEGGLLQLAVVTIEDSGESSESTQAEMDNTSNHNYLILSIAHALYDGRSLNLLHRDVCAAYAGSYSPRPNYRPHLAKMIRSGACKRAERFWEKYIDGVEPTLFVRRSSSSLETSVGKTNRLSCSSAISLRELKMTARKMGVTLQSLAQGSWAAVLATMTRSAKEVVFGSVMSGREDGREGLMMPCMNTVAIRVPLFLGEGDDQSVSAYLDRLRDSIARVGEYGSYPLRKTLEIAFRARRNEVQKGEVTQNLLFNSLFIMQASTSSSLSEGKKDAARGEALVMTPVMGEAETEYAVSVEAESVGDDFFGWSIACRDDYFDEEGTASIARMLDDALRFLIDSKGRDVVARMPDGRVEVCGLGLYEPVGRRRQKRQDGAESKQEEAAVDEEWSGVEETVRSALAHVSGVSAQAIKKWHSIYHLGLDSITAIRVASLLKKEGVMLTVRDMVRSGSVGEMVRWARVFQTTSTTISTSDTVQVLAAAEVAVERTSHELLSLAGFDPNEFDDILPATAMQVHMLSAWQNSGGNIFFPEFSFDFHGLSAPRRVVDAWAWLIRGMPMLRTVLATSDDESMPVLQAVVPASVVVVTEGWEVGLEMRDERIIPLVHVSVTAVETQDGETVARTKLKIHHALYDAITLPLLAGRVKEYCNDNALSNNVLIEEARTWKRYALRRYNQSVAKRETFWKSYLGSSAEGDENQVPLLPATQERSSTSIFRRSAVQPHTTKVLLQLCKTQGIGIQALVMAALAHVFITQQVDSSDSTSGYIVLGLYVANRSSVPEGFACPTLSLVPLRVSGGKDLLDAAHHAQRDVWDISNGQNVGVGLWEVRKWTGKKVALFVNFLVGNDGDGDLGWAQNTKKSVGEEGKHGDDNEHGSRVPVAVSRDSPWRCPSFDNVSRNPPAAHLAPSIKGNRVLDSYPVSLSFLSSLFCVCLFLHSLCLLHDSPNN